MNPILYQPTTNPSHNDVTSILSIHTLTHLSTALPATQARQARFYINISSSTDCLCAKDVPATLEGLQPWKIQRIFQLSDITSSYSSSLEFTVSSEALGPEYTGSGTIALDAFAIMHETNVERGNRDQATIEARLRKVVGRDVDEREAKWGEKEKMNFAVRLGRAF